MEDLNLKRIHRRDVRDVARLFRAAGCSLSFTKKGHVAVRKNGVLVTVLPSSPSDHRSLLNAVRDARKKGVNV